MIARQGRQRARARLPARAARADRRLRRLRRRHRRARPRGRRRPRPRPAARRQGRRPERRRRARRRRDPRLLRRQQRSGRPTRCAGSSRPSPTRRSATSAARCASSTADGGNLEGAYWRYEMAVREMESGARRGHRRQRRRSTRSRRDAYIAAATRRGSHDLSLPLRARQARPALALRAAARAEEKMVPTLEGEFARKRRMMVGLWDIVVGEGMLSPRGYSPLYAFELVSHRLLRYLTPLLHLVAARRQRRPARRGLGLRAHLRRSSSRFLARGARCGRVVAAAPRSGSPATTSDDRLDRRRPLGPRPPRRARAPGRRRRGRDDAARASTSSIAARRPGGPLAASCSIAAIAIRLEQPRPGDLPPAPRRPATAREFEMLKLRTMVAGLRPGRGRHGRHPRRPAGHRAPAASCAAPRSTRSPTWSTSCAARWRSSARARRSRPRSSDYTPRQRRRHEVRPGITGWAQVQGRAGIPWEERIELDVWYVDHRSARLDLRILGRTLWLLLSGRGLYTG